MQDEWGGGVCLFCLFVVLYLFIVYKWTCVQNGSFYAADEDKIQLAENAETKRICKKRRFVQKGVLVLHDLLLDTML